MKQSSKTNTLVKTALLAALVFTVTKLISIPTPIGGSINFGDSIILFSSVIMSSSSTLLIGSLGSALSDLMSPYIIYTPATFVIKGLVGLTSHTLYQILKVKNETAKVLIAFISAEIIMILGYFIFEAYILGFGSVVASLEILNNAVQGSVSVAVAMFLTIGYQRHLKSKH